MYSANIRQHKANKTTVCFYNHWQPLSRRLHWLLVFSSSIVRRGLHACSIATSGSAVQAAHVLQTLARELLLRWYVGAGRERGMRHKDTSETTTKSEPWWTSAILQQRAHLSTSKSLEKKRGGGWGGENRKSPLIGSLLSLVARWSFHVNISQNVYKKHLPHLKHKNR